MLSSIYIPCDSYTSIDVEYSEVLCELHGLQLKHNPMYVICGGDLNTDLCRDMSKHTKSLIQYCIDYDIICSGTITFLFVNYIHIVVGLISPHHFYIIFYFLVSY